MARAHFPAVIAIAVMVCMIGPVTVADAAPDVGWSPTELLETGNSGDAWQQDIAMDESGDAVAIWSQFDGARHGILANRFDSETGWGGAEPIESDYSGNGTEPKVAMDGAGNAIAVWFSHHDLQYEVWSNRYVSGVGWGTASNIDPFYTDALVPEVACDNTGNATAAWMRTGSLTGVWVSSSVSGAGWELPVQIDAGVGWPQPPSVGMDDRGNAIVVWEQSNGTQYSIWANRCVKGIGWGTAEMIETNFTEDAWDPILEVNGDGDAVVVWHQLPSGGPPHVWSNRYIADVGWQEPELLEQSDAAEAWNPRAAIDSDGNAIAVWYQYEDSEPHIWANRYETGLGWTGPQKIDAASMWAVSCEVAMDSMGNAMAVWEEYDGTYSIVACTYIRDFGWMTPVPVRSGSSDVDRPTVGAGLLAEAVVIWSEFDGQYDSIYGASFQPPIVTLDEPVDGAVFDVPVARIAGVAQPGARVEANGLLVAVASNGTFSAYIPLLEGQNLINVTGIDLAGRSETVTVTVTYVNPIHEIESELALANEHIADLEDEILTIRDSLNRSRNDSTALLADLNETRDEIAGIRDELDSSGTLNLILGGLAGVLAVSLAITVMAYLALRKKLGRIDEASSGRKPQA